MRRLLLCTLALQSLLLWLPHALLPAHAQSMLDFALEISAPAGAQCTRPLTLQRAIEERVGRLVFLDAADPSRRIQVAIASDAEHATWSAEIAMRDEDGKVVGERRVSANATSCDALDEALVVVISTLIGIADETRPAKPAQEPNADAPHDANASANQPPPTAARDVPALPAITHDGSRKARDASLALRLSLAARADLGLLPGIAPGLALALDLDFGAWGIWVGVSGVPHVSDDLGEGAAASFASVLGEAGLCVEAARPLGATLDFCAGAQAGAIVISTSGLRSRAVDLLEPLLRGLIGPRLRVPLGADFGLRAGIDATAPLFAPRYFLLDTSGDRQYYHSVQLGISAQIGIEWRFSAHES
jgi:hypothetical protein